MIFLWILSDDNFITIDFEVPTVNLTNPQIRNKKTLLERAIFPFSIVAYPSRRESAITNEVAGLGPQQCRCTPTGTMRGDPLPAIRPTHARPSEIFVLDSQGFFAVRRDGKVP